MLKKFFIPHKENQYKPHVFRETSVIAMLVLIIGVFVVFGEIVPAIDKSDLTAEIYSSVVISGTNSARESAANLPPLNVNPELEAAAQAKANDMATQGYFAHNSPEGVTPWYWIKSAGYNYLYAGENLAIDFVDSDAVVNAWMNSPEHRANILNTHFTDIGVATANGVLNGRPTVFVVQEFGSPKTFVTTAAAPELPVAPINTPPASELSKANSSSSAAHPQLVSSSSNREVLGENNINDDSGNEVIASSGNFIAVKNTGGENALSASNHNIAASAGSSTAVFSTSSSSAAASLSHSEDQPGWFGKIITNPSKDLTVIYFILAAFIIISLIIFVVIESHLQHPKNVSYAILLLVVILLLLSIHWLPFWNRMMIT